MTIKEVAAACREFKIPEGHALELYQVMHDNYNSQDIDEAVDSIKREQKESD